MVQEVIEKLTLGAKGIDIYVKNHPWDALPLFTIPVLSDEENITYEDKMKLGKEAYNNWLIETGNDKSIFEWTWAL